MSYLPENQRMLIDEETWGKDIDASDLGDLTPEMINGHILYNTQVYASEGWEDYELWEHFTMSFKGWTKELFDKGKSDLTIALRDELRRHGIFIAKDGRSVTGNVAKALEGDFHEWTDAEVEYMLRTAKIFNSNFNPNRNQDQTQSTQQQTRFGQFTPQSTPVPLNTHTGGDNTSRLLTDLTKLYNDDKRFGGELYDIFDSKYKIFCDDCTKIGLPEYQWPKALSTMLKGRAAIYYYDRMAGNDYPLNTMTQMMKDHFHTEENRQLYMSEWRETTFPRLIGENPGKSRLEVLQILFDKLQNIQRGLSVVYQQEVSLRDQIINACRGVEECSMALFKPATTYEGVCSDLRSAIGTANRNREARSAHQFLSDNDNGGNNYSDNDGNDQYWTDRTYGGRGRWRGRNNFESQGRLGSFGGSRGNFRRGNPRTSPPYRPQSQIRQKKCYVCNKPNCWSTKHTVEERREAFDKFRQSTYVLGAKPNVATFQTFLTEFEGVEGLDDQLDETQQLFIDLELENGEQFFTEFGEVIGTQTIACLNDQSVFHATTGIDVFSITAKPQEDDSVFTFEDRYSAKIFQGIMPDTGASGVSTAGQSQSTALQQLDPSIQLDTSTAGQHRIRFGKGEAVSIGTLQVPTPLGTITFHIVPTNTPFLLCLRDMDNLKIKFDNLDNVLIQNGKKFPVVRKWGHPWLLLNQLEQTIA
jgi:hypothetical protein